MPVRIIRWPISFDVGLIGVLVLALATSAARILSPQTASSLLIISSVAGLLPVGWNAVRALANRRVTVDLLASIALVATFFGGEWVSAAFINLMLASARLFGAITERRTNNLLAHLLALRPPIARVRRGEQIVSVPIGQVVVGDLVVVESGDRIGIDGEVVNGAAGLNQATLTGESELVSKKTGDRVLSSTICETGALIVRASRVGEDTTVARIIALVDEASREKGRIETLADRFSSWYILISFATAAIIYLASHNATLVLGILLVTCADDIAVAVPLGFTIAIARAARRGVVIKGAAALERLTRIGVFVTDKTGTITRGVPKVARLSPSPGVSERQLLVAAAGCGMSSRHPGDRAIIEFAKARRLTPPLPAEWGEVPGQGVTARRGASRLVSGRLSFLRREGVAVSAAEATSHQSLVDEGLSVIAVGRDGHLLGLIALEDEIRLPAAASIAAAERFSKGRWIMLTGDNPRVAARVSAAVGITEYHADFTPEKKLAFVRELVAHHDGVAMIGDGVNDAAALALADVSIAMGKTGADVSVEAADITLIRDDLSRIPELLFLARATMTSVRQNFAIWFLSNAVGLTLVFGGFLEPAGAAAFNFITDFFPIMNVFRIYRVPLRSPVGK